MTPELQELYDKLTEKQKLFVDLWNGNATETAEAAGYSNPSQQGARILKNVGICRVIKAKRDAEAKPNIMSRMERQQFWSDVALNKLDGESGIKMKDRLKAIELLAKSEGDFIERRELTGKDGGPLETGIDIRFIGSDDDS